MNKQKHPKALLILKNKPGTGSLRAFLLFLWGL